MTTGVPIVLPIGSHGVLLDASDLRFFLARFEPVG
jgi:tryptophanase